ncbi:MAG TPA: DUF47 family protein [Thermomicrobiales bacterium]|nr:hypothetical protein [Chloroflexota bacterium]HCG28178.1 hypothetical protein [Chloroflexota bacterium]HQX62617.1 DUF47 family protein [Thermomicrobiales bacterium]HQZ91290.1 DUF47 family protein [Thermomicrobiales bacterium]HRA33059.1 DUF47 family protein [Thermomicrobiales bacterium]
MRSQTGDTMRWLLPREDTFFVLFERSAACMVAAGEALETFFAGEISADRFQPLDDLEHEGDQITHEVVGRISRTFITPMDRDDIHRLIHAFDDVIDATEEAGEIALLCNVEQVTRFAQELTSVLAAICKEVATLVPYLRGGDGYRQHIVHAHELENQGDQLWSRAFAALFEGEVDTIDVIKWKEIYETLENAIDACEEVAQIMEEIIYKQA